MEKQANNLLQQLESDKDVFNPYKVSDKPTIKPQYVTPLEIEKVKLTNSLWENTGGAMWNATKKKVAGVPTMFGNMAKYMMDTGVSFQTKGLSPQSTITSIMDSFKGRKPGTLKEMQDPLIVDANEKLQEPLTAMINNNRKWITDKYGVPSNKTEQFFEDLTSGGWSLAEALTLATVTGGSSVLVYFGLNEAGSKNEEMKDAGLDLDKRVLGSTISGAFEGGIEQLSTTLMLGQVKASWFTRALSTAGMEGIEEFLQNTSSETISLLFGSKKYEGMKTIKDMMGRSLYAGVIGTLVGGPGGVALHLGQRNQLADLYRKTGVENPVAKANETMKTATEDAIADIKKNLIDRMSDDEQLLEKAFRGDPLTEEENTKFNDLYEMYQRQGLIKGLEVGDVKDAPTIDEKGKVVKEEATPDYEALAKKHNLTFKGVQKDIDGSTAILFFNDTIGKAEHATYAITPKDFNEAKLIEHVAKKRKDFGVTEKEILAVQPTETQKKAEQIKQVNDEIDNSRPLKMPKRAEKVQERIGKIEEGKIALDEKITEYSNLKRRIADMESGVKKGRQVTLKEVKEVRRNLAAMIRSAKNIPMELKNKFMTKLASKLYTKKNVEEKAPVLISKFNEIINRYEEGLSRKKAEKVILKKYKKPQNIVDVAYQKKIDKLRGELGVTKGKMKKSLKQLSTNDLLNLANDISKYTEEGKKSLKTKLSQRRMASDIMKAMLVKSAGGVGEITGIGSKETRTKLKQKGVAKVLNEVKLGVIRPIRLIRQIFGANGEKIIYNGINVADALKTAMQLTRIADIKKSWQKHKITRQTLGKSITVGNKTYQINQILRMYLATKDAQSKEAIIYGNKITEDEFNGLINRVKTEHPNYIKFADDVQKVVGARYDAIVKVMAEIYNMPIGKVKEYFPLYRSYDGEEHPSYLEKMENDFIFEDSSRGGKFSKIEKGFTIARVDIDKHNQKPASLDFIGDAHRAIESQEHLINYAPLQKMFNVIKADGQVKKAVETNFDTATWEAFTSYTNDVINPKAMYTNLNFVGKALKRTRNALGTAYLGFNVVTGLKQIPSLMFALRYSNPVQLINSVRKVLTSKNIRKDILAKNPDLANRVATRDLGEFMRNNTKLADNDLIRALQTAENTIGKTAFSIIFNMDRFAVMAVYDSVYNAQKKIVSEQEARDIASKAVIETQPQGQLKDLPALYRTNDQFLRMALMFTNQLNQVLNMVAFDIKADIGSKKYMQASKTLASVMVSSFLIYLVSHGFKFPEDEDKQAMAWFDAIFGTVVSSVPILGNLAMASFRGYSPSISPIDGLIKTMKYNYAKFKNEDYVEASLDTLANIFIILGIKVPYSQIKRLLKGIVDLSNYDTEDYRRLIWSKSAMFEDY